MPIHRAPERYPVRLALSVPLATAGTLERTVPWDAVLHSMQVFIAPGAEGDLQLRPFLVLPGERRVNLLVMDDAGAADLFISGEQYDRTFTLNKPIPAASRLGVDHNNVDAAFAHFYEIVFDLDETLGGMV